LCKRYVRYDWRSSAEFAKEAVHKQGLVGSSLGEVVTARWANEDPNPVAVMAQKRAAEVRRYGAVMCGAVRCLRSRKGKRSPRFVVLYPTAVRNPTSSHL
jgi:hypothetical protein